MANLMPQLNVPVLLGTARQERRSEAAARFIHAEMLKYGFQSDYVDVRDHLLGATVAAWQADARTDAWRGLMARADGLVIVSPEYNHGYPGELKLLLDCAYKEYAQKPIGVCGVSNGVFGGARMIENLRPVIVGLQAAPLVNAVSFPKVQDLFDAAGNCLEPELSGRLKKFFDELAALAAALRTARQAAPQA